MSKELSVRSTSLTTWQTIQSIAPVIQASRMFNVTIEQAAVVMLKGHELGLGLAAAFEFVHVIDGKPSISPKGALALIQNSGQMDGIKITDGKDDKGNPNACTVWMRRKNGFEYTSTFTMEDAKKAQLTEGSPTSRGKRGYGNWEKYPANMLRWRAIGYVADIVFPDVIGGMYRPEELGAIVDEAGDPMVIDAEPVVNVEPAQVVEPPKAQEPPAPPVVKVPTFQELIEQYGAEAILTANDGRIPADDAELIAVAHNLEAGI